MDVSRVFKYRRGLYEQLMSSPQGLFVVAKLERYDLMSNLPTKAWGDVRLRPNGGDLEAFKQCKDYLDTIEKQVDRGKGVFISGTPGNGKSTWMYKFARRYMETMAQGAKDSTRPVYYANVPELMNSLKLAFKDDSLSRSIETRMKESDIVIFDDIGAENSTDWAKEQLYQYINYRYSNNLTCLFTSNLKLTQLEQRIADRINGSCIVVEFKSQSSRVQKRTA